MRAESVTWNCVTLQAYHFRQDFCMEVEDLEIVLKLQTRVILESLHINRDSSLKTTSVDNLVFLNKKKAFYYFITSYSL